MALLPSVVSIVADQSFGIGWRPHVLGSALVCLASLCGGLGAQMLPYLPQFLNRLVAVAEEAICFNTSLKSASGSSNNKKQRQEVAVLAHSSMASLSAVVAHLPQFMSSHLAHLVRVLTHHSFSLSDSSSVNDGLVHHSSPVIAIRSFSVMLKMELFITKS